MRILYFGIYNPEYSRNRVLIKGLKANGAKVFECRVSAHDRLKYIKLLWQFIRSPSFDYMIVGFPGQEVMFLARFITAKPIVFDAFTSHYGGYILDKQYFSRSSFRAKYYRFLDTWSCRLADLVLLDTNAHIDFFIHEFKLPIKKFRRLFVGTDSDVFYPKKLENTNSFLIHFHGNYIPLQGVKYIIQAAKLLENSGIHFNLIGRGQTYGHDSALAQSLKSNNISFLDPVPYHILPTYIHKADICLGIFGETDKTELVIPNKVFEALACKKPIITSDTKAMRELPNIDKSVLLCRQADSSDLADKILTLKNDHQLRNKISENGYELFRNELTELKIGLKLKNIIYESGLLQQ